MISLILSVGISVAVVSGYVELKEISENLIVDIDTDRPPVGVEPLSINLSANVFNAKGKVVYRWDFGNGKEAEGERVTVTYNEPGIYECVLTVRDETGRKAIDSIQVIVNENRPPIISLYINMQTIERPFKWLNILAITRLPLEGDLQKILDRIEENKGVWAWGESGIVITARVTDPEGDEIVSYEWKEQTAENLRTRGGGDILPVHNLTGKDVVRIPALYAWTLGRHIVTLTVKDSHGNAATAKINYVVTECKSELTLKRLEMWAIWIAIGKIWEKIMERQ